jgi:hypothetical protein
MNRIIVFVLILYASVLYSSPLEYYEVTAETPPQRIGDEETYKNKNMLTTKLILPTDKIFYDFLGRKMSANIISKMKSSGIYICKQNNNLIKVIFHD